MIQGQGQAGRLLAAVGLYASFVTGAWVGEAAAAPLLLDPSLQVNTVVSGLSLPTSIAFIGPNDMLVLEKNTGQVRRVTNGVIQGTVLDLAVNSASERGLLGIALDPNFATNQRVYLHWTASSTGVDSGILSEVPLLGNRVDRFAWNGSSLAFDTNLIQLRARQNDNVQAERGNHNGGPLRFGPDGKLYVVTGDVGRRGQLQNLPAGPAGNNTPDDAFGGPAPDNAHFTGAVLRLNTDGSAPSDNPFFAAGAAIGGQAGANIQKVFAYGIRNSFGVSFDPISGRLWMVDNGDDSFDELNRVSAGMNGGWVQIMGPLSRLAEFKGIETSLGIDPITGGPYLGLQQDRWPASNIADSAVAALAALFALPGSEYSDPEFSWKFSVAPAGLGFLSGDGLGAEYEGNLFVGASRTLLDDGYLYRFTLSPDRQNLAFVDPVLADLVADNLNKFDGTESESLLFGTGFGVVTDVQTGPDGHLYVVSLSDGAIYAIGPRAVSVPAPPAWMAVGLGIAGAFWWRQRRARAEI
jgi:glucose/arabinose dehydrogenase